MGHLVLIAAPTLLARCAPPVVSPSQVVVDELANDLSNLTIAQLHDHSRARI